MNDDDDQIREAQMPRSQIEDDQPAGSAVESRWSITAAAINRCMYATASGSTRPGQTLLVMPKLRPFKKDSPHGSAGITARTPKIGHNLSSSSSNISRFCGRYIPRIDLPRQKFHRPAMLPNNSTLRA